MPGQVRNGAFFSGWTNSNNAATSDDSWATVDANSGANSAYLTGVSFAFNVPPKAEITGVAVTLEVHRAEYGGQINRVALRLAGADIGTAKTPAQTIPYAGDPNTDYTYTYGGSTDLWDTTLTPDDVNLATFGARWRGYNNGVITTTFYTDHMYITVYYNLFGRRCLMGVGF